MKNRKIYFDKMIKYLDTEFIKVITGVRRVRKSFLLKILENHSLEKSLQVLYLNFEHPETFNLQTFDKLYEYIKDNVDVKKRWSDKMFVDTQKSFKLQTSFLFT